MTRDEFTQGVFARDEHTCIVTGCEREAVDAHHLMDRALWLKDDPYPEGYHLDNGASLCEQHHLDAEHGCFPPQALRHWLKLPTILPQQFDHAKIWDKWGKEVPRAVLEKYPRTPYFNFSETQDEEDGYIDTSLLLNKPLVATLKMDGSNVTLTREKVAARNGQYASHPSFDYLKSLHAGFRNLIPPGVKLFGEWLFARHSIVYAEKLALSSYLQIFAMYDIGTELFLGWDEVTEFCSSNGFCQAVAVACGDRCAKEWALVEAISNLAKAVVAIGHEGLVVKNAFPFHFSQHADNVAKIVRPNHVQTTSHWSQMAIVKNEVAKNNKYWGS
jgi:hypothetical protein